MGSHVSVWLSFSLFFFWIHFFSHAVALRSSRWIKPESSDILLEGSGPHAASAPLKAGDDGAATSPTDAGLFLIPVWLQMGGETPEGISALYGSENQKKNARNSQIPVH